MTLFALFGGMGEFDEWADPVHRRLVESGTGDGSACIIPTAMPEGELQAQDLAGYARIGIPVTVVPVRTPDDTKRQENADALGSCSVIFMHGGVPELLVSAFKDTTVWRAIVDAIGRGVSFAATSGGIMCISSKVPRFNDDHSEWTWVPGLKLLPRAAIGSHWDSERFAPTTRRPYEHLAQEELVVGVAESTVAIGDGTSWSVAGEGLVHVIDHGRDQAYRDGEQFEARLR